MTAANKPLTVEQKLDQILRIDVATATANTLESIKNFLRGKEVKAFIKNNNKKTFFGKAFSVIGRVDREELVQRAGMIATEIKEKLALEKLEQNIKAQQKSAAKKFSANSISGKLNKVSKKTTKTLLRHAKPRNLPSSKPYR